MKQNILSIIFVFVTAAVLASCASTKEYPKYDQVLVYDRPYDYTYLKTLEALNTLPGWVLEETDKNVGLIVVRNVEYGHLFDRDKWVAKFIVKSLGRKKTSVELAPTSQKLTQGGDLLKRIDDVMQAAQAAKSVQEVPTASN
ncbi:MAG: hypothetical protein HYS55_04065 [Candidatus Omnitrophica bacterium]|nr:hypothetical protein [Candidatus Omnitrophota bacterium]